MDRARSQEPTPNGYPMSISIANFEVGAGRAFVIAEIGNNHNGSFERAKEMVDLAAEMGADCAKFQMRQVDEVAHDRHTAPFGETRKRPSQ